jgi:tetratricopeptide (TPR) repeat protein
MSKLKDEGNEFFKNGDFAKAYERYTRAIAEEPLACVLYSNRSACCLALKRYREAELDCGIAISLDKSFGKGYFRRAQARLHLGRLELARIDAQEAVNLAPGKATKDLLAEIVKKIETEAKERKTVVGKGDLKDVKSVEEKKTTESAEKKERPDKDDASAKKVEATKAANGERPVDEAKKIECVDDARTVAADLTLVETKKIVNPPVTTSAGSVKVEDAKTLAEGLTRVESQNNEKVAPAETMTFKAPKTAFELETTLAHIGNDSSKLCDYLGLLTPQSLPKVLGIAFSEEMLCVFCLGFEHERFDARLASELLQSVLAAPRCGIVIDFLSDETKARFAKLFGRWEQRGIETTKLRRFCE